MKRCSLNITDEELYHLFRSAACHYDPKLNDLEKNCVWESIANGLLADLYEYDARPDNKWKKRCIAVLFVWLLTGGLAIFRIIQLQDAKADTPSSISHFKTLAPEHATTRGSNEMPDDRFDDDCMEELPAFGTPGFANR